MMTFHEASECDGTDLNIVNTRTCFVQLQTLRAEPFSLSFDDYVVIKIRSMNSFGWSILSQQNLSGAKILTEPIQMSTPTYKPLISSGETLVVHLTELLSYEENNGSTVDSYKVELLDEATQIWTVIQGDDGDYSLNLEVTMNGLVLGQQYSVRASAHNIHGWGVHSEYLSLVSSSVPEQPAALTIQLINLDVQISWTQSFNNYASITGYVVVIQDTSAANLYTELADCDASEEQIAEQESCLIPLTTLRAEPWSLQFDQLIQAQISACNINGCGEYSDLNTIGALVQTEPIAVSMPTEGFLTTQV